MKRGDKHRESDSVSLLSVSYSLLSVCYLTLLYSTTRPASPLVEGGLRLGHGLGPRPEELGVVGLVLRLAQVLVRRALERLEQPDEVRVDLGRVELQPEGELDLVAVRRLGARARALGWGDGSGSGSGYDWGLGSGSGSGSGSGHDWGWGWGWGWG